MHRSAFSAGIIAAAILPLHANGAVDWAALERYISQVAAGSPKAIAMNMAASEVSSLSTEEQIKVIKICKKEVGEIALFSGINATSTAFAVELAKQFVDAGADGLVPFPPLPAFMGPLPVSMISDFHKAIAEVAAVPIIAFQNPFVNYPAGTVKALSKLPSVVAIKDASFDIDDTIQKIHEGREVSRKIGILTGSDTFILEAILMGCDGALIGFAATATAAIVEMYNLARDGRITEAYAIWDVLSPFARIGWRSPMRDYRVRTKYMLQKQGVICNSVVRPPFSPLSLADREDLDKEFARSAFSGKKYAPAGC